MGSELYARFDVRFEQMHTAALDELAADAGLEDLPSHGDGQQVVARLSAESRAAGPEVEPSIGDPAAPRHRPRSTRVLVRGAIRTRASSVQ